MGVFTAEKADIEFGFSDVDTQADWMKFYWHVFGLLDSDVELQIEVSPAEALACLRIAATLK